MEEIKEQLKTLSNETFIDNNQGLINPSANRNFNNALIEAFAEKIKELEKYVPEFIYKYEFIDSVFDGSLEDGDVITLRAYYNDFLVPEMKTIQTVSSNFRTWVWNSAFSSNLGAIKSNNVVGGANVIEIRHGLIEGRHFFESDLVINDLNITHINIKLYSSALNGLTQITSISKG